MSRGRRIVVSTEVKGRFEGCVVSGTPTPGALMEILPATAAVNGVMTYRAVTRADGVKGPIAVLLEDDNQGFLGVGAATAFGPGAVGTAYVTGKRGMIYWPEAGDELNLIVADVAGTAASEDVAIGDLLGVDGTNHGKLKANSSFGSAPFAAMEAVAPINNLGITADYMLWVKYLGNQA